MADFRAPHLFWPVPPWFPAGEIANPYAQPRRIPLQISEAPSPIGLRPVSENSIADTPLYQLTELLPEGAPEAPPALLVMPVSGHYSIVLRDLAIGLLAKRAVYVLDWTSARFAPTDDGPYGFEANITAVIDALQRIGPGAHLIGVCQAAQPCAAAATLMHQAAAPARPTSLSLLGGPIDHSAAPTRLSQTLAATSIPLLRRVALERAPPGFPGAGRLVYPAALHLRSLLIHLARHWSNGGPLYRKAMANDGLDPERFPFLTSFTRVKDIDGEAFAENIATVFIENRLARGRLTWRGEPVRPEAATELAIMTIEAPEDEITAPGQTAAAHRLFAATPPEHRRRLLLPEGGHFALFHGPLARSVVAPSLLQFFDSADALTKQH
ncbi:MAG: hypothetical protein MRY74_07605 [Neomegalonema sp.]|nr:hypothetical protein [Neomegalonema sp.]